MKFKKPDESILKFTKISFNSIESYKEWKNTNSHFYKIQKKNENGVQVLVLNLSLNEEMMLALNENITIISSLSGIEYFVDTTVNILRECFQN